MGQDARPLPGPRDEVAFLRDRALLFAAVFLRAVATGATGVLLGVYLARVGLAKERLDAVIAAGLWGGAVAALLATVAADRVGRRRALTAVALLGGAGGAALASASSALALGIAAFVGMANGMGRDRGAALIVEQAILPATTTDAGRTRAFAWYNVLQDLGHAAGAGLAALPDALRLLGIAGELGALRISLAIIAALVLATAAIYPRLSPAVERTSGPAGPPAPAPGPALALAPESRRIVARISALFALDSVGGGFLSTAFLSLLFHERFGAGPAALGALFVAARAANAASHLGAAWLARRIGLVNTMVFTHIPSSLLLLTVLYAPSFPVAAALFIVREGLVEMDVPTRQSYVMAVVRPEERVVASGITHLVRLAAWAVAPTIAATAFGGAPVATGVAVGAGLKIVYDVLLYLAFRRVKPPEERAERRR